MKNKKNNIFTLISILLALGLVLSITLNKPCKGKIETLKGVHIPMKCNWSYKAIMPLALGILFISILALFLKTMKEMKLIAIFKLILSLISIYIVTSGIGVCSVKTMSCISMKKYILIFNLIIILVAIIEFLNNMAYFNRRKRSFI